MIHRMNSTIRVPINVYSEKVADLMSVLMSAQHKYIVKAFDLDDDNNLKFIIKKNQMCIHQFTGNGEEIGTPIDKYCSKEFGERLFSLSSFVDDCILRQPGNGSICFCYQQHPTAYYASATQEKQFVPGNLNMMKVLCVILLDLFAKGTKSIDFTINSELLVGMTKFKYGGIFNPEDEENVSIEKRIALKQKTVKISVDEFKQFIDFLEAIQRVKRSKKTIKNFTDKYGEDAWNDFIGHEVVDQFKLASFDIIRQSNTEAYDALLNGKEVSGDSIFI